MSGFTSPLILEAAPMPGTARAIAAFLAVVAGLAGVAALFGALGWSWLLWIAVGAVAGVIAGRASRAWLALLGVGAYEASAIALSLPRDTGPFWFVAAIAGALLLVLAFVAGSQLALRQSPLQAARAAWHGLGRWPRRMSVGILLVALVGLTGYTGYIAQIGSQEFVHPAVRDPDCRTPDLFGWTYEAINYDRADDIRLAEGNPDRTRCATQGAPAGTQVVSSDGIQLAGWYVPAANGAAATGPTLVIVPGWKTNKSGVLKYGVPFHATYNLVFLDLRNSGRSNGSETTMGLKEQRDVRAMVDWLVRTKNPAWIGLVGNSMGAATGLAAAMDDPRIRALILDSAHAEVVTSIGNVLETEHGQPALPGSWAIINAVSLSVGGDVTAIDPGRLVTRLGDRPVLLIQGTADLVDPPAEASELTFHAALAAGVDAELQYCQGAPHGKVIDTCPKAWASWSLSFLDRAQAR